jgi:hypothetical protein
MRGAIDGIAPALQPVAHSLLQVREELSALLPTLSTADLSAKPYDIASIDFHVRHIAGSLDRLFTYARGGALSPLQVAALQSESESSGLSSDQLAAFVGAAIDEAVRQVRDWSLRADQLFDARSVGRQRLPSTVIGLLMHAAEHAQRHAGQVATTARIVRGMQSSA